MGQPNIRCMADSGCKCKTTQVWHVLHKTEQPYCLFGSKISKLKLTYKQASREGGRQVLKLFNAWMVSAFKITIHYEETDVGGLIKNLGKFIIDW